MSFDTTAHKTLVNQEFHHRTGYLKQASWAVLEDLLQEAILLGMERRRQHLEALLASSPTIDGWGQRRLVEAMQGESKPDGPAPAAFLGVPMMQQPPMMINGEAPRKKEGLLARLRG